VKPNLPSFPITERTTFFVDGELYPTLQEAQKAAFQKQLAEWLLKSSGVYWRDADIDEIAKALLDNFDITPKEDEE